jgi:hypothetical protein
MPTAPTAPVTPSRRFTLVEPDAVHDLDAVVEGSRVLLTPDAVVAALGWERRPEGLCRGDVCRPVRQPDALEPEPGRLDLAALAEALGRPLALDTAAHAGALGAAPDERARVLRTRVAPDLELADLDGRGHRLSDERGRKVFLVFWASW